MLTILTCKTCATEKPDTDFYKGRKECKACFNAKAKDRYHADEAGKAKRIQRQKYAVAEKKYGLEADVLDALLSGGCMVCGSYNRLAIDHNHDCCPTEYTCGECLRGVLCYECNVSEGLMGSNPDRFIAMAMYLIQTDGSEQNGND